MLKNDGSNMDDVSDSETDDEIVRIKRKPRPKHINSKHNNIDPEVKQNNNSKSSFKKRIKKATIESSSDSDEDDDKKTDSGNVEEAIPKIFNKSVFSSSEEDEIDNNSNNDTSHLDTPVGSDKDSLNLQLSPAININSHKPKLDLRESKLVSNENNNNASKSSSASAKSSSSSSSSESDDELADLRLFRNKNAALSTTPPKEGKTKPGKSTKVSKPAKSSGKKKNIVTEADGFINDSSNDDESDSSNVSIFLFTRSPFDFS